MHFEAQLNIYCFYPDKKNVVGIFACHTTSAVRLHVFTALVVKFNRKS